MKLDVGSIVESDQASEWRIRMLRGKGIRRLSFDENLHFRAQGLQEREVFPDNLPKQISGCSHVLIQLWVASFWD